MPPEHMIALDTSIKRQTVLKRHVNNGKTRPTFKDIVEDYFTIDKYQDSLRL